MKNDRQHVTKYKKWEHELKFDGMNMDEMSVCDVGKFESLNKIKVNAETVDILLVKG